MSNIEYMQQELQLAATAVDVARQNLSRAEAVYKAALKKAPAQVVYALDARKFSQGPSGQVLTDC